MRYKLSISSDGTPRNTHIMIGGRELKGVVKIEIKPINTKGPITARITVASVSLSLRNINTEIVWADLNGNGSDKEREG